MSCGNSGRVRRERRILWFGHLISTWPVVTGAVVHEGIAYAAAGYHTINGVYVYALHAASGQVRWENHESAQFHAISGGNGAVRTITVARGKLWMAGGLDWPVSFDLKTGQLDPNPTRSIPGWNKATLRGSKLQSSPTD